MRNAQTESIATLASTYDSTHGPGPEASAAKMITLLHQSYPDIMPITLSDQAHHAVVQAQSSLIDYLMDSIQHLENPSSPDPEAITSSTNSTFKFIDWILQSSQPNENKILALKQIASIAKTCPGLEWDKNHAQWSTNRIWDAARSSESSVMASPAETLNLLTRALFDSERFSSTLNEEKNDLDLRLRNLFQQLVELQKTIESGDLKKCSAGIQHDLLFLLNQTYLDKPKTNESAKPVLLIESTDTFLLSALSDFIQVQISHLTSEKRSNLILEWIKWRNNPTAENDSPVILFLRTQFPEKTPSTDEAWQQACKTYLTEQCEVMGLNPSICHLDAIIQQTQDIEIPAVQDNIFLILEPLLKAQKIDTRNNSTHTSLQTLIMHRNNALAYFHSQNFTPTLVAQQAQPIQDFYVAELYLEQLIRYRNLTLFFGENEGLFIKTIEELTHSLENFYKNYSFEKAFTFEERSLFENRKLRFLEAKKRFHASGEIDFIQNFFAVLKINPGLWSRHLVQLHVLILLNPNEKNPIRVDDAMIQTWYNQNIAIETGQVVLGISTYEINRILLHGLLFFNEGLTPLFRRTFLTIVEWLLAPSSVDEPISLTTLKKSYPKNVLINFYFLVIIERSETIDRQTKEAYLGHITNNFFGAENFIALLSRDNSSARTNYWNVIKNNLDILIQDYNQLFELFCLPLRQLSQAERADIWNAIKHKLDALIQNGQLANLFRLSIGQLSQTQRADIWNVVKNKLDTLIQDNNRLTTLFNLSIEQLSQTQRTDIWNVVKNKLDTLSQDNNQLTTLFNLSIEQLSQTQRADIWNAVTHKVDRLIQSSDQLVHFFSLSTEQLSQTQRADTWNAVNYKLDILIPRGILFVDLFSLSTEQLSQTQRADILSAIIYNLRKHIQDSNQLNALFKLSPEQLSEAQRKMIWNAVKSKPGMPAQRPDINLSTSVGAGLFKPEKSGILPETDDMIKTTSPASKND